MTTFVGGQLDFLVVGEKARNSQRRACKVPGEAEGFVQRPSAESLLHIATDQPLRLEGQDCHSPWELFGWLL